MGVYNKIYTKEKWEKVNKFNKSLLDDYMMQIKAEGKSAGSQKQYYNDARIILIFVMECLGNKPISELNRKSFRNMVIWMQDNGLSPARINRMLSTGRNLINFGLDDDEYLDEFSDCKLNPSRIKCVKKEQRREIIFLTDEEVHKIFNHLMDKQLYSQALLCALMYDSAGRRKEVFQLTREDIDLNSNMTTNEVIGKRGKKFRLPYHELTKKAFKALEENRTDNHKTLWLTRSNEPASYESLYYWCISWREILNNEKDFNNHSFRHSALEAFSKGEHYVAKKLGKKLTLQELKLIAHHDSVDTTDGYLKNNDEEKLMEVFNF